MRAPPALLRPVEGSGGGGGKGKGSNSVAKERPNTLSSRALVRVTDVVSEGPIRGLVNGLSSVFFDDTPVVQPGALTANFSGVEVWERLGYTSQNPVYGFPAIETNIGVGTRILYDQPIVRTITNANVDAVRVTFRIPALWAITDKGVMVEIDIRIGVDIKTATGNWVRYVDETIVGKTTSPYEKAYRVELPVGGAPWSVRTWRANLDDMPQVAHETYWSFYTEIIDHRMIYPDTAYFGLTVDARDFGSQVPIRGYEIDGLLMKVPQNYNPFTRAYSGSWNGQFKTEWTSNPAWVFYLLATHQRFGLGQWVDESLLDKWGLYAIAQYCDQLVPNGFGGWEPRFTFNAVIHTRDQALKVLQLIASTFRAMAFWTGSVITAAQDRPTDPAILVTPANVLDGQFDYSGVGYKARHSVALITWNDPLDGYRAAIEVVEDAELIERFGWKPIELVAFGCTSRGQAHRTGKWLLDTEKHSTETVTYRASFDHMVANGTAVLPGDVILVQDPAYAGVRFGGRLAGATTTSVELDAPVTLVAGQWYLLHVVLPDGTLAERGTTNHAGTWTTLTFSSSLAAAPLAGSSWVITSSTVAPRAFRVLGVQEVEKHVVQVTALLHDETKYARVEHDIIFETPPFSVVPTGPLPAPTDITLLEYIYSQLGKPGAAVTVSWTASADPRAALYEVQIKRPGRPYALLTETTGLQAEAVDIEPGQYSFRVRAYDAIRNRSNWRELANVALVGLDSRPGNVTGFNLQVLGDTAHLSWVPLTDPHLSHYRIKFQSVVTGATWSQGIDLIAKVSKDASGISLPSMIGTYMIKGVTTEGRESLAAALIVTNIAVVHGLNIVEEVLEHPDFSGAKTNTQIASGDGAVHLLLTEGVFAEAGIYDFAMVVDLGHAFTSRVSAEIEVASFKPDLTMATWEPLSIVDPISGADASVWSATLQVATSMDASGGTPVWSAWQNLVVGDYTARSYKFRLLLTTTDTSVTPYVSFLRVEIDLPDRSTGKQNVLCPAVGTTISYLPAFQAPPAVTISLHGASEGDQVILSEETAESFDIQVLNGATGVERTFNWIAQGFGYVED